MTIFDLVFVVVFLATVVVLVTVLVQALRRRPTRAARLLAVYGVFLALYLGIVVAVSLATPQRFLDMGEDRCFDDWCVAVESVDTTSVLGQGDQVTKANGTFFVVTLRLSNHARGRAQRAASAAVYLRDDQGRRHDVSPLGQNAYEAEHGPTAPLTATLPLGQSLTTVRVFDAPVHAHILGLIVEHPVGFGPGMFVIGDDSSLMHKRMLIRLQ